MICYSPRVAGMSRMLDDCNHRTGGRNHSGAENHTWVAHNLDTLHFCPPLQHTFCHLYKKQKGGVHQAYVSDWNDPSVCFLDYQYNFYALLEQVSKDIHTNDTLL